MLYLKRSWILILVVFLSACIFDKTEPTPTAEGETPAATAENQSPSVSPSPTKGTIEPTLRPTRPPTATAVPQVRPVSNTIFIRSGPGDDFGQIGLLYEDETAMIIGTDDGSVWFEIRTDDEQEGWVAASVVETVGGQFTQATAPTPRPQTTEETEEEIEDGGQQLRVTLDSAYLRSGPGQNYLIVDFVSRGSTIRVLSRTRNGSWFNVRLANGSTGWIGATVTEPVGGWTLDEITVARTTPVPPPTPQNNCDPAYPTVCIPSLPPDLDCRDIPHRSFTVLPPDPHLFDGNENGLGCEPPPEPTPSG